MSITSKKISELNKKHKNSIVAMLKMQKEKKKQPGKPIASNQLLTRTQKTEQSKARRGTK